ncbi:ABC-type protease/lipase transport system%2C ATPase and permease components [Serratia marcescens]|uniref:DUF4214 domain-containing protein n=1 Tax=Serratia marcescens TaxID=615 RepID=UPI000744E9D4|nr:DUF4214 domain-containing protein [Serratia marcescens]CVF14025.1 ABC-type protease/lipase transport system%2C ATPase and permease components [Serratia marcescens]
MSLLSSQQDVAILFYATLGKKADSAALNFFARQMESGQYSRDQLAEKFIQSQDGHHRYDGLTTSQKIQYIYKNTTGADPAPAVLATLVAQANAGKTLGLITKDLIAGVKSYMGDATAPVAQQQHLFDIIDTTLHPALSPYPANAEAAADIQALFYIVGSLAVAEGVNYWSQVLATGKADASYIAGRFVETRSALTTLSNEDFVKTVYKNTFGVDAGASELANYVTGLNNHTETRGDVIMRLIADIRNDTAHGAAKQAFLNATHVYAAGEMAATNYQESVALLFLQLGKKATLESTGLDSYSKFLAAGNSELDLLTILAKSSPFKDAADFARVYHELYYGPALSELQKQAILLKAGNNPLQATLNILHAFRNGEAPLEGGVSPSHEQLVNLEYKIGSELGYQIRGNVTMSNADGALNGSLNTGKQHTLSHAEISQLREITLNAEVGSAVDLSFAKSLQKVTLQGDFATNDAMLQSLRNLNITLILSEGNLLNAPEGINFTNVKNSTVVADRLDMTTAAAQINLAAGKHQLVWQGNATADSGNRVSSDFKATALNSDPETSYYSVSANFFTKVVHLTASAGGGYDAEITNNVNQFLYFNYVDLTHYRGTGEIYLNGQRVATEGNKVFDFGLFTQEATVSHPIYGNINSLKQGEMAQPNASQNATGSAGGVITAYSGDLTLLNVSSGQFTLGGDLTAKSRIHISDTAQSDDSFKLFFTDAASHTVTNLNMGTFSFTSNHKETLEIRMGSNLDIVQNRTLTLSGGDNSISTLMLSGYMYTGDKPLVLNLTVAADFSDNLKTIIGSEFTDERRYYSDMKLYLVAEKGGTGGGAFYNTLNTLANKDDFAHVIAELAGDQLTVDRTGLTVYKADVKGNTTLDSAGALHFTDSKIDNMVTLNTGYANSVISVGETDNPWVFSKTGDKTATLYGSATTQAELQNAFSGLNATDNAQALFSQVLAKMTNGASANNLAEVGLLKLDKSLYVIVDNNHNQTFDADDVVFSIGNQDPYLAAVSLHYHSPAITVNGVAAENSLPEAFA